MPNQSPSGKKDIVSEFREIMADAVQNVLARPASRRGPFVIEDEDIMPPKLPQKAPVTITFSDALMAARKAFDEGRLGAQRGHTGCLNHYPDGAVCPIGASVRVPEEHNEFSISQLMREGILQASEEDRQLLRIMQELHDFWIDGNAFRPFDAMPTSQWARSWLKENRDDYARAELFEDFLATAEKSLKATSDLTGGDVEPPSPS